MKTLVSFISLSALIMVQAQLAASCDDDRPVCATDGSNPTNFNSACDVIAQGPGYSVLYEGDCNAPFSCTTTCPSTYIPVCGTKTISGGTFTQTFDNDCLRRVDYCISKPGFDYKHAGIC